MFAYSLQPTGCEFRMTPRRFETPAGRQKWPPKSRQATGLRRAATRLGRRALGDGYAIQRDDFRQEIIPMYTPEKEAARQEHERAADEAVEAGNLEGNDSRPAIKRLFAEADAIAASIPLMMTRERKHATASRLLNLWLKALAFSRGEEVGA